MSIACRDRLWRDDKTTTGNKDAWAALESVSVEIFANKFERDVPTQSPDILSIQIMTLAGEKAIKVDYFLTDPRRVDSARIRLFLILHKSRWYSIGCGTFSSDPDLFLDDMLKSADSFQFFD